MSTPLLEGKRILVTGAGRGIGRAIAHICANEGARVAICSRHKEDLLETIHSVPVPSSPLKSCQTNNTNNTNNIFFYVTDVTQEQSVDEMVQSIVKKWGGIDILINNAGRNQKGGKVAPTHTLETKDLQAVLDLNIVSVHTVTSSVLRHSMLAHNHSTGTTAGSDGRIINISSRAGKVGIPNMAFYVASKFALEGYTASLAAELSQHNILVNSISPGMVNTESFPKLPGKPGVRTAESIYDGLMLLLTTDKTGHYVHVDELDQVKANHMDASFALKPINEVSFRI